MDKNEIRNLMSKLETRMGEIDFKMDGRVGSHWEEITLLKQREAYEFSYKELKKNVTMKYEKL